MNVELEANARDSSGYKAGRDRKSKGIRWLI